MATGKDILFRGLPVTMSLGDKPYQGIVVKYQTGDHIVIKVGKADRMFLRIMLNTELTVRCIADDGHAYGFKSRLKAKKVPLITISYPEGELEGINVRKMERVPVSFWAELKDPAASGPAGGKEAPALGDANITDMGIGGCKIITQQKLKRGDPVLVEFTYGDEDKPVRLKSRVRSSRSAPYESSYYGLQFDGLTEDTMAIVKKILEDPQKV